MREELRIEVHSKKVGREQTKKSTGEIEDSYIGAELAQLMKDLELYIGQSFKIDEGKSHVSIRLVLTRGD